MATNCLAESKLETSSHWKFQISFENMDMVIDKVSHTPVVKAKAIFQILYESFLFSKDLVLDSCSEWP